LVLSHPSVAGMATKTGTSGSTAWSNSVRSRLYLERPQSEDGVEIDPNARVLSVKKANYGKTGEQIKLRWNDGVFVRDNGASFDRAAAHQRVEQVFVDLLKLYIQQARDVSDRPSRTFAPAVFAEHPNADGITAVAFKRAMENLLARQVIGVETVGPPSKRRSRLTLKG
jgi:RecA-family ATPase